MTTRRSFLAGMLAIGAAPAIVTSKGFLPLHQPQRLWRGNDNLDFHVEFGDAKPGWHYDIYLPSPFHPPGSFLPGDLPGRITIGPGSGLRLAHGGVVVTDGHNPKVARLRGVA